MGLIGLDAQQAGGATSEKITGRYPVMASGINAFHPFLRIALAPDLNMLVDSVQ